MDNKPSNIVRHELVITEDFVRRNGEKAVDAQIAIGKMRAMADAEEEGIKNPEIKIMFVRNCANYFTDFPAGGSPIPKTWKEAMNPNAKIIIVVREKE